VDSTLSNRDGRNRDLIKRLNYPRQSYALSGFDAGDASENKVRGKLEIVGSPMVITSIPPGGLPVKESDDEGWQTSYGASMDSYLSLLEGKDLFTNIQSANSNFGFPYNQSLFLANNSNLYEQVSDQQQIQFIAAYDTIKKARENQKAGTKVQDMRSLCMRAPMHIAGWGSTISMRPTDPNPANPRKNDDEHKLDRSTWKTGPFDMRWDDSRRVWRSWNDLIADQENKKLGTFVFSTNPDLICGFPRLRGKLEDVWHVRRTDPLAPTNPNDDTTSTGEVTTHMNHRLYDPNRNGAGPLSDVFLSHVGTAVNCGAEVTNVGGRNPSIVTTDESVGTNPGLEVKTGAYFHWSDILHGPIHFTDQPLNDGEIPAQLKFINGKWCPYYVDTFGGGDGGGGGTLCGNVNYVANMHTLTAGGNDRRIVEDGVFSLQEFICKWNEEYTKCILKHIRWTASNAGEAINSLNFAIPAYIKTIVSILASNIMVSVNVGLNNLSANIEGALKVIISQLQACFQQLEVVCPIEFVIPPAETPPIGIELPPFNVPGFEPPDCLIESYASYQEKTSSELQVLIETPCLNEAKTYVGACNTPGNGGTGTTVIPGLSFGGTDGDGDNNVGGKSFGDPSQPGQAPSNPNSGTGSGGLNLPG